MADQIDSLMKDIDAIIKSNKNLASNIIRAETLRSLYNTLFVGLVLAWFLHGGINRIQYHHRCNWHHQDLMVVAYINAVLTLKQ